MLYFLCGNGISSAAADAVISVVLAVFALVTFAAFIVLLCKFSDGGATKRWVFAAVLFAGFAIRLIFALCIRGYRGDYAVFVNAFDNLKKNGLKGYYSGDASGVLYPVVYLVYLVFGGISNATSLSDYSLGMQFMIKLPIMAAELITAVGAYKIAKKYANDGIAYAVLGFACICPIFFFGTVWTTPAVFTVMFTVWAFYMLAKKKYAATIALSTAAAFCGKEGIYIFPIVFVFSVFHFVRAIINIKRDKPKGRAVLGSDYCAVYSVPVAFLLSAVGAYLVGLFMISSYSYNIFTYIYEFLLAPLAHWSYFTYNGMSIYAIFGQNGAEPGVRFPSWLFMGIFTAVILAIVCVVYFTKRNRATMVMLGAYALFTMQVYYPGSTAISPVTALFAILAAYILVKDKRLLYILLLSGIAYIVNACTVLSVAGYFNNVADYYFAGGEYTGATLMTGGLSAVCIACSAVAFATHLFFTYTAVTVGMSGNKCLLNKADGISASFKEFISFKRTD